jgi:hypothetical protein
MVLVIMPAVLYDCRMTMYTREALEIAQHCITAVAAQIEATSGAPVPSRLQDAHKMIQAIIDQRGCEVHESGCDELTHLMDVIIFG